MFSVGQSVAVEPLADGEAPLELAAGPGEVAPVVLEPPPPQPLSTQGQHETEDDDEAVAHGSLLTSGWGDRRRPTPAPA